MTHSALDRRGAARTASGSKPVAACFPPRLGSRRMDRDIGGAIAALKKHGLDRLPPLGIVLGSGLGPFADEAAEAVAVTYTELPGFPVPSVEGHAGRLVVGAIDGRRVALFQGRGHYYECGDAGVMQVGND